MFSVISFLMLPLGIKLAPSVWAEAESEEESSFLPSPAELRDGTIPAPDLPEGADCANGVVADARSGYVARLVGAQRLSV